MYKLLAVFAVLTGCASITATAANCPEIPPAVGTVNRDFKADINLSIGSLGKLKMGEIGIKAEAVAKNLSDRYPDVGRLAIVQMMFATYCSMVNSANIPERERLDRLAAFSERLQHWGDPTPIPVPKTGEDSKNKPSPRSQQEPTRKAYDLADDRRKEFLSLLETKQSEPRHTLRIGCVPWSEAACLAAGKFLNLFSEAGWKIDSDKIFKMEPEIPVDGMTIAQRSDELANLERLPPHLGRWAKISQSELVIKLAFTQMGVRVNSSRDPSLSPDTLGIYFGPEPAMIPANAEIRAIRKQIMGFLSSVADVEQICSQNQGEECTKVQRSWEASVTKYLSTKRFDPSVGLEWRREQNKGGSSADQIRREKSWLAVALFNAKTSPRQRPKAS